MALILNLETATKTCSVALSEDEQLIALKEETSEKFSHAEKLNLFIEDVLKQAGKSVRDLSAVAVSAGPGSYTGLRIGSSTAKGLCYGLNIPLISINSLKALAAVKPSEHTVCSMFDARRMEVYAAIYDKHLQQIHPTEAVIVDENSFSTVLAETKIVFRGPGASKCMEVITHENAIFDVETQVSAAGMVPLSHAKFSAQDIEDLAYFEPAYLKDFMAVKPKKLI